MKEPSLKIHIFRRGQWLEWKPPSCTSNTHNNNYVVVVYETTNDEYEHDVEISLFQFLFYKLAEKLIIIIKY